MTRALDSLVADGHGAAVTPEALAGTSPYLNEHLNRFGSYELDLGNRPRPCRSSCRHAHSVRAHPHRQRLCERVDRILAMVRYSTTVPAQVMPPRHAL